MPPTKRKDQAGPSEQKRTRFASPPPDRNRSASLDENDDLLEEDLQQGAGRAKQKSKRQLQDKEGYGSDSSDDEEGVVPSRRAKEEPEEDVDMFGSDTEKDDKKDKGKEKKKEFMDMNDIEGQEFDRRRGGTTDEESESEPEDGGPNDERAGRKKRKEKDLGFEVTAFNMKAEMDEGKFTADGEAYVENEKDPNDKHDVWLTDMDKDAIRKARKAHREREKQEAEREEAEARGVGKEREVELMRAAVGLMERGETILEAMQRLGHEVEEKRKKDEQGKKKTWAEKQKERKALMAEQEANKDDIHTSNPFTNLSNIVSGLTTIGHLDVYSLSRESIQRMLPASSRTDSPAVANGSPAPPRPVADARQFQYRYSMAYIRSLPEGQRPVERELFGPFPLITLSQWKVSGAFGPDCQNIELRTAGDDNAAWGSWSSVVGA